MRFLLHGVEMNASELLNAHDAAEFLGISQQHMAKLASAGKVATFVKAPGLRGARFFHRDELARVAAERNLAP